MPYRRVFDPAGLIRAHSSIPNPFFSSHLRTFFSFTRRPLLLSTLSSRMISTPSIYYLAIRNINVCGGGAILSLRCTPWAHKLKPTILYFSFCSRIYICDPLFSSLNITGGAVVICPVYVLVNKDRMHGIKSNPPLLPTLRALGEEREIEEWPVIGSEKH